MIPKVFHFIWLNRGAEFDYIEYASIMSKLELYPQFKCILWCDSDMRGNKYVDYLVSLGLEIKDLHSEIPKLSKDSPDWNYWISNHGAAFECDYYRQHLLYKLGGIYSDLDSISLNVLPPYLFELDYVSCIESLPNRYMPGGAFIGFFMTVPESEYLKRFIKLRSKISVDDISNMQLGLVCTYKTNTHMLREHKLLPINYTEAELTRFVTSDERLEDITSYEFHCYNGSLKSPKLLNGMISKVRSYIHRFDKTF